MSEPRKSTYDEAVYQTVTSDTAGYLDWETKITREVMKFDERGAVVGFTPYVMTNKNGSCLYEYPKGSGNVFYGNGQPYGRVEFNGKIREFTAGVEHKAYTQPSVKDPRDLVLHKRETQIAALTKQLNSYERGAATSEASQKVATLEAKALLAEQGKKTDQDRIAELELKLEVAEEASKGKK